METVTTFESSLLSQLPTYMRVDTVPMTATPAVIFHSKYTHGGGMMVRVESVLGVESLVLYRWGTSVVAVHGPSALTVMAHEIAARLGVC